MKICDVVINSIWCDPRVRKQINEYIAQKDVELSCVGYQCPRYNEEKVKLIPCKTTIVPPNKKYIGPQKSVIKKLKRAKSLNQDICNAIIAENPDVIHANDLNALIPAYMASKKLGCKLIYDSHEVFVENFFNKKMPLYALYLKAKERRIVKKVDKMICVSYAAAEYFAKEYKIPTPTVITNCSLKSEICEPLPKNPGFEILNHGQFYAGRGYDIMIEAAKSLNDYPEIKMALRGYGTLEESLKSRAKELNAKNVVFHAPVLVQELIPYASKSMVGLAITEPICLNFKLSVSNKLFEYASAGLPVIMSDIPEHRYLNEKYKFGIIIKENTPEALAEAAIKLYTDKELYQSCVTNAKVLSEEINWENEFTKLIEFERSII